MNEKAFVKRIEEILKNYEDYRNNEKEIVNSGRRDEKINYLITRIKAIVKRISGNDSEYYKRIKFIDSLLVAFLIVVVAKFPRL
jgi:hypothetical protein